MRIIKHVLLAAILALAPTGGALADADPVTVQEVVDAVEATYKDVQTIRADFVQVTRSAAMPGDNKQRGKLQLKRPRKMKMEFAEPDAKLVVTNGKKIWLYNPADKQVFVYQDMGGGGDMGMLLDDLAALDEHFEVSLIDRRIVAEKPERKNYVLELVPKKPSAFQMLRIVISRKKFDLERVIIIDQMGNETDLSFKQIETNVDLPDAQFEFEAPEGSEVIEGM